MVFVFLNLQQSASLCSPIRHVSSSEFSRSLNRVGGYGLFTPSPRRHLPPVSAVAFLPIKTSVVPPFRSPSGLSIWSSVFFGSQDSQSRGRLWILHPAPLYATSCWYRRSPSLPSSPSSPASALRSDLLQENKLQILRELAPFQNGFCRSAIIGNNSFCTSITTVGHPEASLGQDNTTSPDVDQPQRIKFKRLDKTAKHIMNILDKEAVEKVQAQREIPDIRPGYIIQLKVEVPENKRRVSVLKGIVIARRNAGLNTTFRLRRLVAGVGVESVFPLYSPNIKEVKVLDKKKVRRAKLYYLRDRMNPLKK